jgi:hypothetical protein
VTGAGSGAGAAATVAATVWASIGAGLESPVGGMSAAVGASGPGAGSAAAGGAVGAAAGDGNGGVGREPFDTAPFNTAPSVPGTVVETFSVLDDETVTVCVSGPSSPGLRTRTETEMLHPEQLAAAGPPASVPQLQFQFQFQPPDAGPGLPELDPPEGSEQFQFQFHVQFCGGVSLDDVVFDEGFCVEELILLLSAV